MEVKKTQHETLDNQYATFVLRPASENAPIHVFDFALTDISGITNEQHQRGTVTHDMMSSTVEMKYADGSPVLNPSVQAALSDALLVWLCDNGYLVQEV